MTARAHPCLMQQRSSTRSRHSRSGHRVGVARPAGAGDHLATRHLRPGTSPGVLLPAHCVDNQPREYSAARLPSASRRRNVVMEAQNTFTVSAIPVYLSMSDDVSLWCKTVCSNTIFS